MKSICTRILSISIALVIIAISACKKPISKQAQYLPKDAVYVMSINGGAIKGKLKDEAFSLGNLLNTITGSDSVINSIKEKLNAFKNAGVDLEAPIYMAFAMKNSINNDVEITLAAGMKNATDFEDFLKKQIKNVTIQKSDNISYIDPSNGLKTAQEGILGWTKDVVIFNITTQTYTSGYNDLSDTSIVSKPPSKDNPNTANNSSSLERLKKIFNQKEEESLLSISEFKSLQQEKSDATIWLNMSSIISKMPIKFPKMKTLLENSYMAATVNFNDGEVVLDGKSYVGKELREIYKKYAGPTIDLNLLEKYPTNNLNGFIMFSFKPAIVTEVMKALGIDGLVNVGLMASGLTLNNITDLFKGDFMVAASDLTIIETPNEYESKKPKAKWLVTIPFGDKTAVDKVMNNLIQKQLLKKEGNNYIPVVGVPSNDIALNINDKSIIIASDNDLIQQYISGAGKTTLSSDVQSMVKDKALALYVDIDKLLTAVPTSTNEMEKILLDKSKALFKDVIITADNYNGTYMKHKWVLRLKDQKENSIKQLYKYAQTLIEIGTRMFMANRIEAIPPPVMPTTPVDTTAISPKADDYENNK